MKPQAQVYFPPQTQT